MAILRKGQMIQEIVDAEALELSMSEEEKEDRAAALFGLHRYDIREIHKERFPKKDMRRLINKQGEHWLQ